MEKIPINKPQIQVPTPDITHSISLKLRLPGGPVDGYQIQDFQMDFQQDINYKGQPEQEVTGGIMSFVITQVPDDTINKWMMDSRLLLGGSFVFRHLGHVLLTILFEDAYCVGYKKSISSVSGVATLIVISPQAVNLNGIPHENFWKKGW
jgi:hypothetical protein